MAAVASGDHVHVTPGAGSANATLPVKSNDGITVVVLPDGTPALDQAAQRINAESPDLMVLVIAGQDSAIVSDRFQGLATEQWSRSQSATNTPQAAVPVLLKTLRGINEFTAAQEAQVLEATETEPTRSPTQPASAGSNGVPLMAGISIMFVAATITTLAIRAVATKRTKTTEPTQNHRRDLAHVANLFGSSQDYGTIRKRIMASLISIDDDLKSLDSHWAAIRTAGKDTWLNDTLTNAALNGQLLIGALSKSSKRETAALTYAEQLEQLDRWLDGLVDLSRTDDLHRFDEAAAMTFTMIDMDNPTVAAETSLRQTGGSGNTSRNQVARGN